MTTNGFAATNRGWSALVWLARLATLAWVLSWACNSLAAPPIPGAPSERVTDKVGVMSQSARMSLERRLAAYEDAANHQIVVWIDRSTGGQDIESFAAQAFEAWKIGRAQLDDGLAIFMMVEDRTVRIEVGYGLEGVVTDLVASEVIRTRIIPPIQRGNWDAAVSGGVEGVVDAIEGTVGALPADPSVTASEPVPIPAPPWLRIAKIIGAVLLGLALLILLITHPRLAILSLLLLGRGGGGGGFGGGGGRSGGGGASGRW